MKNVLLMTLLLCTCTTTKDPNPIVDISAQFLGLPYSNVESAPDKVFQNISGLNCMTFVETVMSIARQGNPDQNLKGIRYYGAKTDEVHRKHFVSADWLPHNREIGFVEDITSTIYPEAKVARAKIDKGRWFHKSKGLEVAQAFDRSKLDKSIDAKMSYIPIEALVGAHEASTEMVRGQTKIKINTQSVALNPRITSKIPNGAIVSMVHRDSEKFKDRIGSSILVGHIGFVIRKDNELYLRHADQPRKMIMDLPLSVFLNSVKKKFKGINVSVATI